MHQTTANAYIGDISFFEFLFNFPARAKANGVPVVCATPDEEFDKALAEHREKPDSLDVAMRFSDAAEACKTFNNFSRMGVDGQPVTYDQFYKKETLEALVPTAVMWL